MNQQTADKINRHGLQLEEWCASMIYHMVLTHFNLKTEEDFDKFCKWLDYNTIVGCPCQGVTQRKSNMDGTRVRGECEDCGRSYKEFTWIPYWLDEETDG